MKYIITHAEKERLDNENRLKPCVTRFKYAAYLVEGYEVIELTDRLKEVDEWRKRGAQLLDGDYEKIKMPLEFPCVLQSLMVSKLDGVVVLFTTPTEGTVLLRGLSSYTYNPGHKSTGWVGVGDPELWKQVCVSVQPV